MTIGERIKQRRMELGLSVDEVAEKLGKNRATVYRYESNEIENLPVGTLEPLAKILETTPAQLMGWEDEEQDENYRRIFARNLNRFLEINGKNQADIATLLNVSQAAVSNWCKGIKMPRMDKVQALADYFGVNKSDLLEEKDRNGLSSSDRKDIAKNLDEMMEQLQSGTDSPLMYNGQELSEASKALLRNALEYALTETKKENKVKYNPNKNKG
nr:helix-turn-helix transcriptional regulator [uncultured Lachnoanaerobaculum sp.]